MCLCGALLGGIKKSGLHSHKPDRGVEIIRSL